MDKYVHLNSEPLIEIEEEVCRNPKYIKADKEFRQIINKELSKEKAEHLNELLDILTDMVGNAYLSEGIILGREIVSSLLFK